MTVFRFFMKTKITMQTILRFLKRTLDFYPASKSILSLLQTSQKKFLVFPVTILLFTALCIVVATIYGTINLLFLSTSVIPKIS